jgi:hypothetical protein
MTGTMTRPDPDLFGLASPADIKVIFDVACKCPNQGRASMVHFLRVEHPATNTVVEHSLKRHGDPHYRKTRLRMVRDAVIAATGDAPEHPLLDDWRYDRNYIHRSQNNGRQNNRA